MKKIVEAIRPGSRVVIKGEEYGVRSKVEYTLEEDVTMRYYKCELDNGSALVIIPEDELCYVGSVVPDMEYQKLGEETLVYDGDTYKKTGAGHQITAQVEFGADEFVEGECDFEDFESGAKVISLGVLANGQRADILADVIRPEEMEVV